MQNIKNVGIGVDCWRKVRQQAVNEDVSYREILERAVDWYLRSALTPSQHVERVREMGQQLAPTPARIEIARKPYEPIEHIP